MKLSLRLKCVTQRALAVLPLLLACHAAPVLAAPVPPSAESTLDVCQDQISGNWRYSGVVAVAGKTLSQDSVIGIDFKIQNQVSAGYIDALRATRLADDQSSAAATTARVARFSIDAAPLLLGTVRNASRVVIFDPLNLAAKPLTLEPRFEFSGPVCGCSNPTGCTRTQGYWKSKPGAIWPSPYSRTAMFFSSGLTWQQILQTPPAGGSAYLILAHQYIAASLNRASGASAPSSLQTVLNTSKAYFSGGTNLDSCGGSSCETQKTWAGMLDTYNDGRYPGAPAHCP